MNKKYIYSSYSSFFHPRLIFKLFCFCVISTISTHTICFAGTDATFSLKNIAHDPIILAMSDNGNPVAKITSDKEAGSLNNHDLNFVKISFDDLMKMFGEKSNLTKDEKKQIWNDNYRGKYVEWTGSVKYKGGSIHDWNKVGISHTGGEDADVQLKFNWRKREKVEQLETGETIIYTGKLTSIRWGRQPLKLTGADIIFQNQK